MTTSLDPKYFFNRKALQKTFLTYGVDTSGAQLIRANTNLVYDCGDCIVRLTPSTVRAKSEIESELHWLQYLVDAGVPVVRLISGSSPIRVEIDSLVFWGVAFVKIKGRKVQDRDWTGAHFAKLGALSGQLHKLGHNYRWEAGISYKHWDQIPEFQNYTRLSEVIPDGVELHQAVVTQIKTLDADPSNYGLVHYDIHHGNYLLKEDGELVLFDFELCCLSWYIHDIATILYYAESHPKSQVTENFQAHFLHHFFEGYQQEFRSPSEEEKNLIPIFLLYRDLMVYAYLLDIWASKTLTKHQERYQQRIKSSIYRRRQIFENR